MTVTVFGTEQQTPAKLFPVRPVNISKPVRDANPVRTVIIQHDILLLVHLASMVLFQTIRIRDVNVLPKDIPGKRITFAYRQMPVLVRQVLIGMGISVLLVRQERLPLPVHWE